MQKGFRKLSPARIIALGFASVILIGSGLLMLPCSVHSGVHLSYIDALYTATSAVCVTGLCIVDTGTALTPSVRVLWRCSCRSAAWALPP